MASNSKIEWTDATWNPATGCTPISQGCQNCYAKALAKRFPRIHSTIEIAGGEFEDFSTIHLHYDRLEQPLTWKKPRRVFVCSMGDLFHDAVPFEFIHKVWDVMKRLPQHTFKVLTKRPERMNKVISQIYRMERLGWAKGFWDHVWLGVTVENQEQADKRIPLLLQTEAAKRFVSIEPMLGEINLTSLAPSEGCFYDVVKGWLYYMGGGHEMPKLDWVICGGENGSKARPMHPDWVRSLRDQCQHAAVPFFFKGWGQYAYISVDRKIGDDGKIRFDGKRYPVLRIDAAGRDITGLAGMENDETDTLAVHCGKKVSGRLLDEMEWSEFPEDFTTEHTEITEK